ncbi:MAG: hypothetical protein RBT71_00890 [Flavobacteriales bacterium]|jgi:hypothetical protein|nr:hypothetical protein [Flavobacteriales bacterium]
MRPLVIYVLAGLMTACAGRKPGENHAAKATTVAATAPAFVYRTQADRRDHVPVLLSADRTAIVSYPHPRDLRTSEGFPLPTDLGKGWLLDNRGIGPNVAFLRHTYAEYAALEAPPSLAELEAAIMDRDPLRDFCDCGKRSTYTDIADELRQIVARNALTTRCKKLK